MLNYGDKIGIVCCSNGQKRTYIEKIKCLENTLIDIGLQPVFSDCVYEKESIFSGTAEERANALMNFYKDDRIKGIFDISGGDVANSILPYLDYDIIANSSKMFWGYSDLTTVINAIYKKTGKASVLYQVRNLIYDYKEQQIANFKNTIIHMLWSSIFVTLVAKNILFRLRHSCFMWSSVTIITMWAHIIVFNI